MGANVGPQGREIWFRYKRFHGLKAVHWKAWALRVSFCATWLGWMYIISRFDLLEAVAKILPGPDSTEYALLIVVMLPLMAILAFFVTTIERHSQH